MRDGSSLGDARKVSAGPEGPSASGDHFDLNTVEIATAFGIHAEGDMSTGES